MNPHLKGFHDRNSGVALRSFQCRVFTSTCIESYDKDGRPNLMTASWAGISCSKPPAVTLSLRKATYIYGNIILARIFMVSS